MYVVVIVSISLAQLSSGQRYDGSPFPFPDLIVIRLASRIEGLVTLLRSEVSKDV